MPFYKVTWTIELDADTPKEAALLAQDIQHQRMDWGNTATCFEVQDETTGKTELIDLYTHGYTPPTE
jgi:hypothetical protein